MKLYTAKAENVGAKSVALDDMILTKELPTSAGSRMLDGYMSLFDATVVTKLAEAGYDVAGKLNVGEFAIDLLGETSYYGALSADGKLASAAALALEEVSAVLSLDVNGAPRRGAAQSGTVYVKPTYGTVSRFGIIPVACSGECVGITAKDAGTCAEILSLISGHDDKDGTSLADELCKGADAPVRRGALVTALCGKADTDVTAKIEAVKTALAAEGIAVITVDGDELLAAKTAWNILMCAELCNNVSRYDGIKFGYRTPNYKTIDELYTGSRTEAFGALLKTAILFGSDTLSTENYDKVYDKALRVRRVLVDYFKALFEKVDAVLMPATSKMAYTEEDAKDFAPFTENLYTAPASITGLPAVVFGGVQLVGKAFSERALLSLASLCGKGDK